MHLLTHWGWDKTTTVSQKDIITCIFVNASICVLMEISLKFVSDGPIDNIPALIQIMAVCLLSEAMMA